ncbi:hypothetical protein BGZ98_009014 [Dissophora globulifera]|nr:hypothetical protein BGZ98_009014 [Dissophora globulifera]
MDLTGLQEEALAIVSIYGPASFYALPGPTHGTTAAAIPSPAQKDSDDALPVYTLRVSLEEPDFDLDPTTIDTQRTAEELELRVYFPTGYPETNTSAPVHEVVSIYYGSLRLTDAIIQEIDQGLEECFVPGEVIIFSWIDWLRTFLETLESRITDDGDRHDMDEDEDEESEGDDQDDGDESQKLASDYFAEAEESLQDRHGSSSDLSSSLASLSLRHGTNNNANNNINSPRIPSASGMPVFNIRTGQPIVDRKSVFVAHLAAITQPAQVPWMIQQLKHENKKVIKATHNIMAFRVENENGTIAQGKSMLWSQLLKDTPRFKTL